jgi:hypothetical protein
VGQAAEEGGNALILLGIGAGVFALIVVLTLLWAARRSKVHREELAQRDGALILLANAIKASEEEPWAPELKKVLRRTARDNDGAQYLRRVLHDRPELRLSEH